MKKLLWVPFALGLFVFGGCAAPVITYKPAENQIVTYNQGVGTISDDEPEYSLYMYPFREGLKNY